MDDWADELHVTMLQIVGAVNRPDIDADFIARAGVKLDRALFPLLSRIGIEGPIGTVELAADPVLLVNFGNYPNFEWERIVR
jgi:hypothetical protein